MEGDEPNEERVPTRSQLNDKRKKERRNRERAAAAAQAVEAVEAEDAGVAVVAEAAPRGADAADVELVTAGLAVDAALEAHGVEEAGADASHDLNATMEAHTGEDDTTHTTQAVDAALGAQDEEDDAADSAQAVDTALEAHDQEEEDAAYASTMKADSEEEDATYSSRDVDTTMEFSDEEDDAADATQTVDAAVEARDQEEEVANAGHDDVDAATEAHGIEEAVADVEDDEDAATNADSEQETASSASHGADAAMDAHGDGRYVARAGQGMDAAEEVDSEEGASATCAVPRPVLNEANESTSPVLHRKRAAQTIAWPPVAPGSKRVLSEDLRLRNRVRAATDADTNDASDTVADVDAGMRTSTDLQDLFAVQAAFQSVKCDARADGHEEGREFAALSADTAVEADGHEEDCEVAAHAVEVADEADDGVEGRECLVPAVDTDARDAVTHAAAIMRTRTDPDLQDLFAIHAAYKSAKRERAKRYIKMIAQNLPVSPIVTAGAVAIYEEMALTNRLINEAALAQIFGSFGDPARPPSLPAALADASSRVRQLADNRALSEHYGDLAMLFEKVAE